MATLQQLLLAWPVWCRIPSSVSMGNLVTLPRMPQKSLEGGLDDGTALANIPGLITGGFELLKERLDHAWVGF
jgi:hypothetical protein